MGASEVIGKCQVKCVIFKKLSSLDLYVTYFIISTSVLHFCLKASVRSITSESLNNIKNIIILHLVFVWCCCNNTILPARLEKKIQKYFSMISVNVCTALAFYLCRILYKNFHQSPHIYSMR